MNIRLLIAATLLGITACVTSGQERPEPASKSEIPVTTTEATEAADQLAVADVPVVPVSANVPPPEDEIVCRKERRIGSYIPVRVCRTRAQMAADREEGQDTLDTLSRRTYSGRDRE